MISQATLQAILDFRRDRNWEQFHSSRNLATALTIESAELLEHFRWVRSEEEEREVERSKHESIRNEIADVAILLGYLASGLGIDLDAAIADKLKINGQKYPIAESFGSARKYDELSKN